MANFNCSRMERMNPPHCCFRVAIDPKHLPGRLQWPLQQMVRDPMAQLDRYLTQRSKNESQPREMMDARYNRKSEQRSPTNANSNPGPPASPHLATTVADRRRHVDQRRDSYLLSRFGFRHNRGKRRLEDLNEVPFRGSLGRNSSHVRQVWLPPRRTRSASRQTSARWAGSAA